MKSSIVNYYNQLTKKIFRKEGFDAVLFILHEVKILLNLEFQLVL